MTFDSLNNNNEKSRTYTSEQVKWTEIEVTESSIKVFKNTSTGNYGNYATTKTEKCCLFVFYKALLIVSKEAVVMVVERLFNYFLLNLFLKKKP